jgi:hypothetical protein
MLRVTLLFLVALLSGADWLLQAQESVEARGITSAVKLEEVIYGHVPELNGRFKLRATELTLAPDAYLGGAPSCRARDAVCAFRRAHIHPGRAGNHLSRWGLFF